MATPILYSMDASAPVRTVKIVAKNLGVELDIRDIDLRKGEHLHESFLQINPEHTLPTLVDGETIVWDSHAIITYLVDKYGIENKLYPKDLAVRAKVNQRLFFEASSLYPKLREVIVSILFQNGTMPSKETVDTMHKTLDILEIFLAIDHYLVGNGWTIADISVANSILLLKVFAPLNSEKYPKILAWLDRVNKNIPHFAEINGTFPVIFAQSVTATAERNKSK